MRILIAYDGSQAADEAVALARSVAWPPDSTVRVVAVAEPPVVALGAPWAPGSATIAPEIDDQMVAYLDDRVADAVQRLKEAAGNVKGVVLRGRPATAIVDEARELGADVIVAGSRGHGAIAELVLGSVTAEVVDQAPCPVLVARRPALSRVVFATDGSEPSAAAEKILEWPIFAGLPVRVVSVANVVEPWHTGIAPTMYRQVVDAYTKDLEESRAQHRKIAEEAAGRIAAAGRTAEPKVLTGDAATAIIAAAHEFEADLVVIGSRGQTGLARMVLGSVARNVLHGSGSSVLVVHPPRAGRAEDRATT
jgi:nucleotide-binding universal stress UspA family protein